jgi:lycopene cyclase domain-containing protein
MLETKWLYLLLNLGTICVPLLRSFESRVAYYKSFPSLFKSMLLVSGFFLLWDIWFTEMGVWGFTLDYLCGVFLLGLPLGEYLFFITVPFSCVFIYRVLDFFFPKGMVSKSLVVWLNYGLIILCLAIGLLNLDKAYTSITFLLLAAAIIYVVWIEKVDWMGKFYQSYLIALIPFILKNGILTGSITESPVVWYDNSENLGVRLATIPFEDVFYGMLLILGTVYFYEKFETKRNLYLG